MAMMRPYIRERFLTFFDPSRDPLGESYQIKQSLMAIGSGGVTGRGFGQSIQKFEYLPEPIGDSIFAVMSEEFGLIGSSVLIFLFLMLAFAGFRIAKRAGSRFSKLLVTGIVVMMIFQAFSNIGSMLGVIPLSGTPLLFVSHGGTALFVALIQAGIILAVSRYDTIKRL
jgi:cell division protein FtsW